MEKQLLIDTISFEPQRQGLNEALSGKGPFIVKGIFQRCESKNQNGRIYPKTMLMKEAESYSQTFIKERRALGELDHPQSEIVNLKNVSHNILELFWEGNDLMGSLEVLSTPSGNILRELFKSNIRVGISSRGLGTIKKMNENTDVVQDDYNIISWDIVSNPSTQGAFLFSDSNNSLNESVVRNPITNNWTTAESIIQDIFSELS